MPKTKPLALSDLVEQMDKYSKELKKASDGKTKAYLKDGTLGAVLDQQVKDAYKKLDEAVTEVSEVCQQAVLAILIEQPDE